ncbi:MAG TPA: hypothetical protein VN426_15285 [Syntrophomonadaceae bacterium]|nr:hypothetical protein [Syntrophomonadaceae bacterium]
MEKACRIWSPVVMAELKSPQEITAEKVFTLEEQPSRMEELKVRLRSYSAHRQGRAIEAEFNIEVISLLENEQGIMRLFSRQETFRDRLSAEQFTGSLEDTRADLILDVQDMSWSGEIRRAEILMHFAFSYSILAVRPQPVTVLQESQESQDTLALDEMELLHELQLEIVKAEGEKLELKRKIRCYETDIQSLRRGVSKAERRNQSLYREVHEHQEVIEQLRRALGHKEASLSRYQKEKLDSINPGFAPSIINHEENASFGGIIKRLFQNSL